MFRLPYRRLPRHPLGRVIGTIVGIVLLMGLLALGAFALVAVLVVGAVVLLVNSLRAPAVTADPRAAPPPPPPGVIEGEFTVVREPKRERSA